MGMRNVVYGVASALIVGAIVGGVGVSSFDTAPRLEDSADEADEGKQVTAWPGDKVTYVATARRADGRIVFSWDPEVVHAAELAGNPVLMPEVSFPERQARNLTLPVPAEIEPRLLERFHPAPYIIGAKVGQVVTTPAIVEPYGQAPKHSLPFQLGPLPARFDLNLTDIFQDAATNPQYGSRSDYVVGNTVLFAGTMRARVDALKDDNATLTLVSQADSRITSAALGIDLVVRLTSPDQIMLEPLLQVGQRFQTHTCDLPSNTLQPGTYEVLSVGPEGFELRKEMTEEERLIFYGPLQFDLKILTLQKAS
jgi:hypothetical protein